MKRKLYSNMKRMTSLFCVAILCVTLTSLMLRLTVFSDMALSAGPGEETSQLQEEESDLLPYVISRRVTLETPASKGDFRISNPETNSHYITVSVVKPDTGENLLYTGFIKPGQSREQMALHIQLPQGIYDCTAVVTAFDPDTLAPVGSEEREITLYIGEKIK